MAIQFISTQGGQRKGGQARGLIGEINREPGYEAHIRRQFEQAEKTNADPETLALKGRPPEHLELDRGLVTPTEAYEEACARADRCKDPLGRKLRSDAVVIQVSVASYPVKTVDLLRAGKDSAEWRAYEQWERDTLASLRDAGVGEIRSATRHTDEARPHLHVVGILYEDGTCPHPGLRAKKAVRDSAENKRQLKAVLPDGKPDKETRKLGAQAQARAYCDSMRQFQDDFFDRVSIHHGHARFGPRRARLERGEWLAQQAQLKAVADANSKKLELERQADRIQESYSKVADRAEQLMTKAEQEKAEAARLALAASRELDMAKDYAVEEKAKAAEAAKKITFDAKIEARSIKQQATGQLAQVQALSQQLTKQQEQIAGREAALDERRGKLKEMAQEVKTQKVELERRLQEEPVQLVVEQIKADLAHQYPKAAQQLTQSVDRSVAAAKEVEQDRAYGGPVLRPGGY